MVILDALRRCEIWGFPCHKPHDTTLICSCKEELMELLNWVKIASEKKGLLLNTKKTKIMVIDKGTDDREFILDGEKIEEIQQFEYLVQ